MAEIMSRMTNKKKVQKKKPRGKSKEKIKHKENEYGSPNKAKAAHRSERIETTGPPCCAQAAC